MRIVKKYCKKSACYKAGKTIKVKGIMIHSVGTPQPKAAKLIKNWNTSRSSALAHGIIEPGGKVYQLMPWNRRGWHAGTGKLGSANNTHIGVEMTEPSTIRYKSGSAWVELKDGKNTKAHVTKCYKNAVQLFAYLCEIYDLDPMKDGVIISHSEGHKRGIASNHGDVEHIWSKFGYTMSQFRNDIKAQMEKNKK